MCPGLAARATRGLLCMLGLRLPLQLESLRGVKNSSASLLHESSSSSSPSSSCSSTCGSTTSPGDVSPITLSSVASTKSASSTASLSQESCFRALDSLESSLFPARASLASTDSTTSMASTASATSSLNSFFDSKRMRSFNRAASEACLACESRSSLASQSSCSGKFCALGLSRGFSSGDSHTCPILPDDWSAPDAAEEKAEPWPKSKVATPAAAKDAPLAALAAAAQVIGGTASPHICLSAALGGTGCAGHPLLLDAAVAGIANGAASLSSVLGKNSCANGFKFD
mmetsp:Transcript_25609/g.71406  ORF Transcript_25609/g.71406 Transcript_25609/m.71406 type:complete len:286 (-) Transcript_25609:199-1056(-)